MIKAIVLDDGHHDRTVVINYGINYAKKSLSSFVNELCSSHSADYQVKQHVLKIYNSLWSLVSMNYIINLRNILLEQHLILHCFGAVKTW